MRVVCADWRRVDGAGVGPAARGALRRLLLVHGAVAPVSAGGGVRVNEPGGVRHVRCSSGGSVGRVRTLGGVRQRGGRCGLLPSVLPVDGPVLRCPILRWLDGVPVVATVLQRVDAQPSSRSAAAGVGRRRPKNVRNKVIQTV